MVWFLPRYCYYSEDFNLSPHTFFSHGVCLLFLLLGCVDRLDNANQIPPLPLPPLLPSPSPPLSPPPPPPQSLYLINSSLKLHRAKAASSKVAARLPYQPLYIASSHLFTAHVKCLVVLPRPVITVLSLQHLYRCFYEMEMKMCDKTQTPGPCKEVRSLKMSRG